MRDTVASESPVAAARTRALNPRPVGGPDDGLGQHRPPAGARFFPVGVEGHAIFCSCENLVLYYILRKNMQEPERSKASSFPAPHLSNREHG